MLPALEDLNREFWTAGRQGELRLRRCRSCSHWIHPPWPVCPRCHSHDIAWSATSGRGAVFSYTVNHKAWSPGVPVPYVIAIVELPEQEGLRLTTNLVNCAPAEVSIGMPVRVTFEQQGEHFVPLFGPDPEGRQPEPGAGAVGAPWS